MSAYEQAIEAKAAVARKIITDNGWDGAWLLNGHPEAEAARAYLREALRPAGQPASRDLRDIYDQAIRQAVGDVEPRSVYMSLDDFYDRAEEELDWIWDGILAPGTKVLPASKPKVGKSILLAALRRAVLAGEPFLGRATRKVPWVLISEEAPSTLRPKVPPRGTPGFHLTFRGAVTPQPSWTELIEGAPALTDGRPGVLEVDTLRKWGGREGLEKDANVVEEVLGALDPLLAAGWVAILVHHARKADGEHGDAVSGTNALTGDVDVIMEVGRVTGSKTQRMITFESRHEQTPGCLIGDYDLATRRYHAVAEGGDTDEALTIALRGPLLEVIRTAPGINQGDLIEALGGESRKHIITRVLGALADDGELVIQQDGRAHRHYLAGAPVPPPPPNRKDQTIEAIQAGATPEAVAEDLGISVDTVKRYLREAKREAGRPGL